MRLRIYGRTTRDGEPDRRSGGWSWLDAIPGGHFGAEADRQWKRFASVGLPVVTMYGSYDTGKSALLRRLIVDSGSVVPEWLTISARHETFGSQRGGSGGMSAPRYP